MLKRFNSQECFKKINSISLEMNQVILDYHSHQKKLGMQLQEIKMKKFKDSESLKKQIEQTGNSVSQYLNGLN